MHVIVVGCGRVGSGLATSLEEMGHTVSVIDKRKEAFDRLPERWSGRAVLGFGFERQHLEQAGASEAGALAAVTNGDNTNILTARIARENFGIDNVVARIYDPQRAVIFQKLGIPTVATVTWTKENVLRRLFPAALNEDWVHPTGEMSLIEQALPSVWAGKSLDTLIEGNGYRLVGVSRAGHARLSQRGQVGQEGDVLHIAIETDGRERMERALAVGPEDHK